MRDIKSCSVKLIVMISFLFSLNLKAAQEVTIFDVRKTLPLTDSEKIYKDYYLNGGSELGFKPGMVITVKRRIAMYDGFQNKSLGELMVAVGKIKIIHVQNGVSVAREFTRISRKNLPLLDYNYIMVGDKLDLNTIYMDRGKKKSAKAPTIPKEIKKTAKVDEDEDFDYIEMSSQVPMAQPN